MEDTPIAPLEEKETKTSYYSRDYSNGGPKKDNGISYKHDISSSRQQIPLPTEPPYTAHLGNLSFNITESEISDFFGEPFITNIRLMRDRIDDRPKGFGYVEFTDLQALINAISLNGKTLSGRAIKISVAEPPRKGYIDRDPIEDRTAGEWRRSTSLPLSEPSYEKRFSYERRGTLGNNDNPRDFSNWKSKGPLQDLPELDSFTKKRSYLSSDRRNGDKFRNSGFGDRSYGNNFNSTATTNIGERPKLVLKPRGEKLEDPPQTLKPSTKPNPFGDALPVDSDARIREIEEKEQKRKEERLASEEQKGFGWEKIPKEPSYKSDRTDKKEANRRNHSLDFKCDKTDKNKEHKGQNNKSQSINSLKPTNTTITLETEINIDGWSTVNKLSRKR
ncbi:hypothetical protein T552_00868 [Pneumocystis carinii B80]|uniref:RRM domain-containing protein n=1 Tax=Pneumocystis carinii (strain B80) TaxID=1408658 RepID=A0A0W4ZMS2_PNEC8|nr:hypothetical protein T552_00868 [Pneumocystis carinii B80]KTW29660.1 hypothetical protein T552_00868 [Pneumocystis carinii B80]